MADEHDKWLNPETAERLLSGESLEAVDVTARDRADRLAEALGALSAEAAPATGELPGEEAALAAFRKIREAAAAERTAAALGEGTSHGHPGLSAPGLDAGLVRIAPPAHERARIRGGLRAAASSCRLRWGRPVRLVLAAAVAAGTVGGVAMAAGGVLPSPFRHQRPGPGASVSATATPGQPLTTPSPRSSRAGGSATGMPDAGPSGSTGAGSAAGEQDTEAGGAPGSGASPQSSHMWWKAAVATCRDLRDGKEPAARRKRVLEDLAGGSARVKAYCGTVLTTGAGGARGGEDRGDGKAGDGDGRGSGRGDGEDKGGDDDGHRDHRQRRHHGHRRTGIATPVPTAFAPTRPGPVLNTPAPASPLPSPSYRAL